MAIQAKARFFRFWHCLFRIHCPETWFEGWPPFTNTTRVRCYTCGKEWTTVRADQEGE